MLDIRWSRIILMGMLALMTALGVANCGKPVPVQPLAEARGEIERAENLKAEKYSPESYQKSRDALLAAHKLLTDEKFEETVKKANEAKTQGLQAASESAPKYAADEKKITEAALGEADEAYAEALAKDDFQNANKLYGEANELTKESASADAVSLRRYATAISKYQAASEAAKKAKNTALAQKDDLLQSLNGVQSQLQKAEGFHAPENFPTEYQNARNSVEWARRDIQAGKLKRGNGFILKAEELTRALLASAMERYALEKKTEANKMVAAADKSMKSARLNKIRGKKGKNRAVKARESLAAAKESLQGSETKYTEKQYEGSIKDSEDAIRLARIFNEQLAALGRRVVVVTRGGVKTGETGKTGEAGVNAGANLKGWKKYVVRRKQPVDCLWRIAGYKRHYGNPRLWKKIFRANRHKIRNSRLIFPGQVFDIPPRSWKGGRKPKATVAPEVREKKEKKEVKENPIGKETQPRENIQ